MGTISEAKDIADAVVYLTEARHCNRGGAARGRRCAPRPMVSGKGLQPGTAREQAEGPWHSAPRCPDAIRHLRRSAADGLLLFLSGMLPVVDHKPKYVGRLGKELDAEAGTGCRLHRGFGRPRRSPAAFGFPRSRSLASCGWECSSPPHGDFFDQPRVADAVSDLFRDIFGSEKAAVRVVIGVASLPLGMPVEVEVIFEVGE